MINLTASSYTIHPPVTLTGTSEYTYSTSGTTDSGLQTERVVHTRRPLGEGAFSNSPWGPCSTWYTYTYTYQ